MPNSSTTMPTPVRYAADIAEYRLAIIEALADWRLGQLMEEEGDDGAIRDMLMNGTPGYHALTNLQLLDAAAALESLDDEVKDAIELLREAEPLPPFAGADVDAWVAYVRAVSPSPLGMKEAWQFAQEAYEKHRGVVPDYTK